MGNTLSSGRGSDVVDQEELEAQRQMSLGVEVLRRTTAAVLIQRVGRGHIARAERRRIAWAASLSQRQYKKQRTSIAVLQLQLTARHLLQSPSDDHGLVRFML